MKSFLNGPSGQIFAIAFLSFSAGTIALLAFEKFLRSDAAGWFWSLLAALLCFSVAANCVRLRKLIP